MSGRKYSDAFKAEALAIYEQVGLNEAARRLGIDKKTILRWADDAGVDRIGVSEAVSERNRRAAAAKNARVAKDRAEARERVLNRVIRVSEAAATRELELLARGGFEREDLQAVTNARTKAIQQFELLEGRATSRTDSLLELDGLLDGVLAAFATAIDAVPDDVRAALSATFAHELRQVRERGLAAIEAGDPEIEDAEIVEETEEAAA